MERTLDYTLLENIPETKSSLVYHGQQPDAFQTLDPIRTSIDAYMLNHRTAAEECKLAEKAIRRFKEEIEDADSHLNLTMRHAWQLARVKLARNELIDDMARGVHIPVKNVFSKSGLAMKTEIRHEFEKDDIPAQAGPLTGKKLLINSLKELEQHLDDCDPIGVSNVMDSITDSVSILNDDFEKLDQLAREYEYDEAAEVLSVIMKKIQISG